MQRLTLKEVNELHGGMLPPDATFRADDEPAVYVPPVKVKVKRRANRSARFALLNAFADFALADLTGAEVKVWLILFRDTQAATGCARTGQADLARRAGLSHRAVKMAVRSLQAKGFLHVVRRGHLYAGPSLYRVHPTGSHGAT